MNHVALITAPELTTSELLAISLVAHGGPHRVGVIDDENTFAAALIFENLKRRGYVLSVASTGGPVYHLTAKAKALLP